VFQANVKAGQLPQFSYYTPNINDDSHDQSLDYSGNYLKNWLATWHAAYPALWKNVLFMVTFDEDQGTAQNHVVAFFINQCVSPGTQGGNYNHYSVTKWVEDNWTLGTLGENDVNATSWNTQIPYKAC